MFLSKVKIFFKKHQSLLLILFIALAFRLSLIPLTTHGDLFTQSEWGNWLYTHNFNEFYSWNQWLSEWPNHPPLISWFYFFVYKTHSFFMMFFSNLGNFIALNRLAPTMFIWFFDFTKWYGSAIFPGTFHLQGITATIKFFMIFSDLAIAVLIYQICKQAKVSWKKYVLAYLFLPFSWYLSALWGQSDPLASVFLIISFILLNSRYIFFSPLLFALSLNLKPTGLILAPLFLWVFYKQRRYKLQFLLGFIISLIFTLYITSLFTQKPLIEFIRNDLIHRLFSTKTPFTVVSSFNFWFIFHAKSLVSEMTPYLFIPAKIWGYIFFTIITFISFLIVKAKKIDTIFLSIFISSFGAWLFMTNMYERYVFAGLVSLLLFCIYHPKYFKYFLIFSFIFWINLYHGWWQPPQLDLLKDILLWNNRLFPRLLSIVNVFAYLKFLKSLRLFFGFAS